MKNDEVSSVTEAILKTQPFDWDDLENILPIEDQVKVELANGTMVTAKVCKSSYEQIRLQKRADEFVNMCQKNAPKEWVDEGLTRQPKLTLLMAFVVSEQVIDPPINHKQALKACITHGGLIANIYYEITKAESSFLAKKVSEAIDIVGEDLEATASTSTI